MVGERIQIKLSTCKGKLLSLGERLVLINLVLSGPYQFSTKKYCDAYNIILPTSKSS
jgi:hypothetical protein